MNISNICLSQVQPEELPNCLDLMDSIASPSDSQCLDPNLWRREVWIRVAADRPHSIHISQKPDGPCAECKVCGNEIDIKHELFGDCSCCRQEDDGDDNTFGGSLLRAIADVLVQHPPRGFAVED